jgi:hypothetical protein
LEWAFWCLLLFVDAETEGEEEEEEENFGKFENGIF